MQVTNHSSGACIAASLTMFLGYCLIIIGVVSPSWRLEIGYTYGLWARCDDVCTYMYMLADLNNFLTLVQGGVIGSLLLMTSSMVCLVLEALMIASHATNSHMTRTGKVATVTGSLGVIITAMSLGLYGCKTVMARERFPVLSTGFALTGVGVIVTLLGLILRSLGPPVTWGHGMCGLAPKLRYRRNIKVVGSTLLPPGTHKSGTARGKNSRQGKDEEKSSLVSCFHTSKNGYLYSSVPSTKTNSLEKGYRHYEEINFEDMPPPPPPLELLNQHNSFNPTHNFRHEFLSGCSHQDQSFLSSNPNWNHYHSYTPSSPQYSETTYVLQQQHPPPPESAFEYYDTQTGPIPQATPRHARQQRSLVKSAHREMSTDRM